MIAIERERFTARVSAENAARSPRDRDLNLVSDCLCARALCEATGEDWSVGVGDAYRKRDYKRFDVSENAQWQIVRWIKGLSVEPFEFTVEEVAR